MAVMNIPDLESSDTKAKGTVEVAKPGTTRPTSPYVAPAPAPYDPGYDGSYDGYGGGLQPGMGGGSFAPAVSDDDWLNSDAAFQAQLAALIKASQDYEADNLAQQTRYTGDYNDALKSLGFMQDNADTADIDESGWNFKDLNTAAGRSFQNQQNDFAGRGMLQSSLYATANDNLTRSLNDQLSGVNTAKQSFFDDLARQQSAFTSESTLSQQQARAEALARRASTFV